MWKFLTICLVLVTSRAVLSIDLTQNNKYGSQSILNTTCNKDTQIDFLFTANSKFVCSSSKCSNENPSASSLKFMDINGNNLDLKLVEVLIVANSDLSINGLPVTPTKFISLRFTNTGSTQTVAIILPIVSTASLNGAIVTGNYVTGGKLAEFLTTNSLDLTAFSYLNQPDYSRFYHVTNSARSATLLISSTILYIPTIPSQAINTYDFSQLLTPDYSGSGDKLCYASNQVQGLFQTHLRESWPLWTWMISIMFYWLFYLVSDSETHKCYEERFNNNKMTCWSLYSLFHLANLEYFSRLSRVSLVYFVFSFQAMILAALYSTLGDNKAPYNNFQMIIWTAAIAFGVSIPIPYFLGGIFLTNIYKTTLQKFQTIKSSRGQMINKAKQTEDFENKIDTLEQRLYSYYFLYYIIIFAGVMCFWIPSIYMMMQTSREWYYLHRIWLASLAITFVIDNVVFDPILSAILGNTRFYQIRGYFYQFRLGQEYKQIEE